MTEQIEVKETGTSKKPTYFEAQKRRRTDEIAQKHAAEFKTFVLPSKSRFKQQDTDLRDNPASPVEPGASRCDLALQSAI